MAVHKDHKKSHNTNKSEGRLSKAAFQKLAKGRKFGTVMKEFGKGTLRSSSGQLVTDISQAAAIAKSEQQRANKRKT